MMRTQYIHLAVACLIFGLSVGLVAAGMGLISAKRTRAKDLATEVTTKQLETQRVAAAKEALPALAADEQAINQYFVKSDDIVPFLEKLQVAGKTEGAVVQVLSVTGGQAGTQNRISLSLNISGSFEAVMRTIGSIEYGPYDIALTNVTLDSRGAPEKGTTQTWTAAAVFTIGTQPVGTTTPKK